MRNRLNIVLILVISFLNLERIFSFKKHFLQKLHDSIEIENPVPVIGVLLQDLSLMVIPKGYHIYANRKYIAASYVQYLEQSGARIVPIDYSKSYEDIENLLNQVNGVFIPGGAQLIYDIPNNKFSEFHNKVDFIIKKVKQFNDEGVHYPLWGTCLGLQYIITQAACTKKMMNHLGYCDLFSNVHTISQHGELARLRFVKQNLKRKGLIYNFSIRDISPKVLEYVENRNVSYFFHHLSLGVKEFEKNQILKENFDILITSQNSENQEIVALLESKKYPIFASQFHPEKTAYEFSPIKKIVHTHDNIQFARYLSDRFVLQAKQNNHKADIINYLEYSNHQLIHIPGLSYNRIYIWD